MSYHILASYQAHFLDSNQSSKGTHQVPQAARADHMHADWYDPGSNRPIVVKERLAGRQNLQLSQELSVIGL